MIYYKVYNTEDASEYYIVHEHNDPRHTSDDLIRAMKLLGTDGDKIGIAVLSLDMSDEGLE